jgi:phosphoserine aminotransferase
MVSVSTPDIRPANPNFSSGPCAKRPGFTLDALAGAFLGRSHRAAEPKARLVEVISLSRSILGMPADWRLGIVPGSDTGAVEMALWSMLGARPVDIVTFESFGEGWATDIVKHLKLADARILSAPYGKLPDLSLVDPRCDLGRVRDGFALGQAGCGDLVLAESAGR